MGTLLGIALVILAAYSTRKLFSASSQPLKLGPEETAIGEVLVKTDDLRHHTIRITYPHNDEGRLVITNLRLLYLSYDQKRTTLAVPLGAISQVEVGKKKGLLTSTPAVTVIYQTEARSSRTTWSVPTEMVERGSPLLFMGDKRQVNPHTADQFAALLNRARGAKHPASAEQRAQGEGEDKPVAGKVKTLDDALTLYKDRDFKSPAISQLPAGTEIQLGSLTQVEGREWIEAHLSNGDKGYLLGASVRSHSTRLA